MSRVNPFFAYTVRRFSKRRNDNSTRRKVTILAVVGLSVVGGAATITACIATGQSATGARLEAMKASPNWHDGRFVNSIPTEHPSLLKSLGKWLHGTEDTIPESELPVVKRAARDTRWWPPVPWKTAEQEPIVSSGIRQSLRTEAEPSGGVR